MRPSHPSSLRRLPSFVAAAALMAGAGVAQVQAQGSTPSTTQAPRAEMQRGVPGIDVELGTNGRAATNGVPGVDVDLRSQRAGNTNGVPGTDADLQARSAAGSNGLPGVDLDTDTRVSGAGAAGQPRTRAPIQDRN